SRSKIVRVPADHLVVNFADHVGHAEAALFARNLRMKNNLQEQIPHFFGKLRVVSRVESFQDLVSLFQKISPQAVMGLLTVPRAASGGPQPRLHGDEFFKPFAGSQLFHLRTARSEEHTSELQSQSNLVCRLLLEKKKK